MRTLVPRNALIQNFDAIFETLQNGFFALAAQPLLYSSARAATSVLWSLEIRSGVVRNGWGRGGYADVSAGGLYSTPSDWRTSGAMCAAESRIRGMPALISLASVLAASSTYRVRRSLRRCSARRGAGQGRRMEMRLRSTFGLRRG
jgi:hypothetical protein